MYIKNKYTDVVDITNSGTLTKISIHKYYLFYLNFNLHPAYYTAFFGDKVY